MSKAAVSESEILVRALEPEDIPAVTRLLNQPRAVWGSMQLPFTSVATRRTRYEARDARRTDLAALVGGEVVGWLFLTRFEGRRAHVGSFGMAVHDDHTGRGVGVALMRAALDK